MDSYIYPSSNGLIWDIVDDGAWAQCWARDASKTFRMFASKDHQSELDKISVA